MGRPVPSHQQAAAHPDARVLETVQRPGFPAEEAQLDLALPEQEFETIGSNRGDNALDLHVLCVQAPGD